jgi:integrase
MNKGAKNYNIMKDPDGFFRPGQREAIYNACNNNRDRLLIRLLWKTGRRIGEILNLKVKNINFDEREVMWFIEKKKREYPRWKPCDSETINMLKEYTKDIPIEEYVFKSTQKEEGPISRQRAFQIIRKLCEKAGIDFVGSKHPHPHHFRHSFAVDKARKLGSPADMRSLQLHLEHDNMGMTEQYLQFGNAELRKLIDEDD